MQPASEPEANIVSSNFVSFMMLHLRLCFFPLVAVTASQSPGAGAGPFFHQIENRRDEEDPERAGGHHTADNRGSHDLARYRACAGCDPQRHAPENKRE